MDEGGMLINLSAAEAPPSYQPDIRGGSWKERLVAKRLARHRQNQRNTPSIPILEKSLGHKRREVTVSEGKESGFPEPRSRKRPKYKGDFTQASREAGKHTPTTEQGHLKSQSTSQPREVISSLFTYNAKPTTKLEPSSTTDIPSTKPSNAPLVDGADTFTSLGLSNVLANFLVTKLGLKKPTAIQKSSLLQLLKEDSDAFIQSETGSGKTLAYLLPVLQRLMLLSTVNDLGRHEARTSGSLHRDSGLFAIVLAPTRELCKQISVVLERLLGCAHWLVGGTVTGGEKKKSEKARLRKGLNILVATPGRLADHLENTKVLDVANVRWLVLDEGDRLMELGFEDDIQKIVKKLDDGQKTSQIPGLPLKRTSVLCSATMKSNIHKLGEISLKDAALIKPDLGDESERREDQCTKVDSTFYAPAQLRQSYSIVAPKLRLVTLTSLLKRNFARKGSVMKVIVFVACADSVEFHYAAFTRPSIQETDEELPVPQPPVSADPIVPFAVSEHLTSAAGSQPVIYKLHGSLPQPTRTSILRHFTSSPGPSLLFATDVASRGLDLPNLDLVIEYDPPFSSDDHLHRIGRTARLGRDGRAFMFLLPGSEEGYVKVLRSAYHPSSLSEGITDDVTRVDCNDILRKGFSPTSGVVSQASLAWNWESQATAFQLECERWVLSSADNRDMAKKAFQSHVRAYATHVSTERQYFDMKQLHLGHLAKAFGLRDAPARLNVQGTRAKQHGGKHRPTQEGNAEEGRQQQHEGGGGGGEEEKEDGKNSDAARKMKRKMREMGRIGAGAGEFNIA